MPRAATMPGWFRLVRTDLRLRVDAMRRRLRGQRRPPLDTTHAWRRVPCAARSRKTCVLACYVAGDTLSRHTLHLAEAWHAAGFLVVLVVACDRPERIAAPDGAWPYIDGLMVRNNSGYDFGSWATALAVRPDLREASLLVLTNDSVYGPLDGFARMIERAEASDADVIGAVDSFEFRHHLQSFLVFYKPRALASKTFGRFWRNISGSGREEIVVDAEIPLMTRMLLGGLKVDVLFPSTLPIANPTLRNWRDLVDSGFPFVKVHLLKANTHVANIDHWDELMVRRGYDPRIVVEHMAGGFESSAAASAATQKMKADVLSAAPRSKDDPGSFLACDSSGS